MRTRLSFLAALVAASLCAAALHAQGVASQQPDEVETSEVLRRGDRVVEVGDGHRDGGEVLYTAAMAPPADDSDQWFVTVWGTSRDPATRAVVAAFEKDPHLAAFVATPPGEGKRPWSHFNRYYADDNTQRQRFSGNKIPLDGPFPIVTIQTPRNGQFGPYGLVVDRIPAAELGDQPAKLAERMRASLQLYLKKFAEARDQKRFAQAGGHQQADPPAEEDRESFPWGPDSPPAQEPMAFQWPTGGPAAVSSGASLAQLEAALPGAPVEFVLSQLRASATVQQAQAAWQFLQQTKPATPTDPPSGGLGWVTAALIALFGGGGTSLVINLVFYLWGIYRRNTTAAGNTLLLSDADFEKLKSLLTLAQQTPTPK